jgi:hypothetical protein
VKQQAKRVMGRTREQAHKRAARAVRAQYPAATRQDVYAARYAMAGGVKVEDASALIQAYWRAYADGLGSSSQEVQ